MFCHLLGYIPLVFKGFQECFEFPIFLVLEHATAVIKIDYTCKKPANAIQTVYTRKNAALNISHMKLSAAVLYRKTLSYCIYIERAPPRMTLASFKSKSVTAPRRSFKKKCCPAFNRKENLRTSKGSARSPDENHVEYCIFRKSAAALIDFRT